MTLQDYLRALTGKSVAVIGIGVSNQPLLNLLLEAGIDVTACDKKDRAALGALGDELEKQRLEWEIKEAKRKQAAASIDRAAIRRKLTRLKELYVAEMIDLDEYRRDYELYTTQLAERTAPSAEEERPNFEAIEAILETGFRKIYDGLEREEKRTLWRSVIKEIRVDKERQITGISFL